MIEQYIEALIFASDTSLRKEEIAICLQTATEHDISEEEIDRCLQNIRSRYADENFAIELVHIANGYQFLTKKICIPLYNNCIFSVLKRN